MGTPQGYAIGLWREWQEANLRIQENRLQYERQRNGSPEFAKARRDNDSEGQGDE